jgi:hypothetical protein
VIKSSKLPPALRAKLGVPGSAKLARDFIERWNLRYGQAIRWETEYRFHEVRKWRFDLACGGLHRVAVEIMGGVFVRGGHSRGAAQIRDWEKQNEATLMGWRVLVFTPDQMRKPATMELIRQAFKEV